VKPDQSKYQPMGAQAIMVYAPEQNGIQDKARATLYLDQRLGGQLLDDSHSQPALQKKT
jgi:hypothetical protein